MPPTCTDWRGTQEVQAVLVACNHYQLQCLLARAQFHYFTDWQGFVNDVGATLSDVLIVKREQALDFLAEHKCVELCKYLTPWEELVSKLHTCWSQKALKQFRQRLRAKRA